MAIGCVRPWRLSVTLQPRQVEWEASGSGRLGSEMCPPMRAIMGNREVGSRVNSDMEDEGEGELPGIWGREDDLSWQQLLKARRDGGVSSTSGHSIGTSAKAGRRFRRREPACATLDGMEMSNAGMLTVRENSQMGSGRGLTGRCKDQDGSVMLRGRSKSSGVASHAALTALAEKPSTARSMEHAPAQSNEKALVPQDRPTMAELPLWNWGSDWEGQSRVMNELGSVTSFSSRTEITDAQTCFHAPSPCQRGLEEGNGEGAEVSGVRERAGTRSQSVVDGSEGGPSNRSGVRKQKRVWRGPHTPKRAPPQKPWTPEYCRSKMEHIATAIQRLGPGDDDVAVVLELWLGKLTRVDITAVIRELGKRQQPERALAVFQWADTRDGGRLRPNAHMCSAMMGVLGRARMLTPVRSVFEYALRVGAGVHAYNAMMGACVHAEAHSEVWELLTRMQADGHRPDVVTYNTVLQACVKSGADVPSMLQLLERMRETDGLCPDTRSFNTLLLGLKRDRLWRQVPAVLAEMRAAGEACAPDQVTYTTALSVYARAGRAREAREVMGQLHVEGLHADVRMYSALVEACAGAGRTQDVLEVLEEMRWDSVEADSRLWAALVRAYARAASRTHHHDPSTSPSAALWHGLVSGLVRRGMLPEAAAVVREMPRAGVERDASLYNMLIASYSQENLPSHAVKMFRIMKEQGIAPDQDSFSALVIAHCQAGQVEEAEAALASMVAAGYHPSAALRSRVASACDRSRGKEFKTLTLLRRASAT